ncbi:hypothetical protein D3C71_1896790 [compost metagenome]
MADDQDADVTALQRLHDFLDLGRFGNPERCRRFIEKNELACPMGGARDRHALTLPAGEIPDRRMG